MDSYGASVEIWDTDDSTIIPSLLRSAAEAHGTSVNSPQWFSWKYQKSPWGPATIAYARTKNMRIVGAVAFGTYRLATGDDTLSAGISYETFVHPDFQGHGLFTRLLAAAENAARVRDVTLLLNFPNQASRKGFLNAGWTDVGGVRTWIRPVSPVRSSHALVRSVRLGRSFKPDPPTAPLAGTRIAARLDGRVPMIDGRYPPALSRLHDPAFTEWRYLTRPTGRYDIVEHGDLAALLRLGQRGGYRETQILEVYARGSGHMNQLRGLVRAIATETQADFLSVLATRRTPMAGKLPTLGFIRTPNSVNLFSKSLELGRSPERYPTEFAICGADIHTW